MNSYCCNLKFPFELFESNHDCASWLVQHRNFSEHFTISPRELNCQLIVWLNQLGLSLRLVEIFYRTPESNSRIHVDTDAPGDYVKLNYVYGGGASVMNWYQPNENSTATRVVTPIYSHAVYYRDTEVELLHSQTVGQPGLVQVGVPHRVCAVTEERFCVSLVIVYTKNLQRLTFLEAKQLFKDYIV